MTLNFKTTPVFTKNYEALQNEDIRFIINMGGTRSSKTWSISQLIILYCLIKEKRVVSVVRKSFPSLRATVMRDIIELLREYELYDERQHNKTENIYNFSNGSKIEFFSLDDSQKIRGRKRDLLFMNEANELDFEEFNQLNFRTNDKVIMDFNPSESDHFIYDLLQDPRSIKIHSTFRDNPFLSSQIVKEIEDLIQKDNTLYQVYNLGLPADRGHIVYNHQKPYYDEPLGIEEELIGIDFGYSHPTAVISLRFKEDMVFCKELLYQSYLTSADLILRLKDMNLITKTFIADGARPEIIEDMRRAGFIVHIADKNIKAGIDAVKSQHIFYHGESFNLIKEFKNYKWKIIGDKITEEPLKLNDDLMDAMRYGVYWYKKLRRSSGGFDFANF